MSAYRFQMGVRLTPGGPAADIEAFTDALIEELLALDRTADVQGSLTSGEFFITVTVEADETFEAVDRARALIRTAAHAAGATTAAWPRTDDVWSWMRPTGLLHADPAGSLVGG